MALSNDLVSQFAKAVAGSEATSKTETTVYGTVKIDGDKKTVEIDGSNYGIPLESTTDVQNGDRVTVMIKNHTAVVTGNLSTPAINKESTVEDKDGNSTKISELGIVLADKVNAKELEAEKARIDTLYVDVLEVEDVEVEGELKAKSATIEKLQAADAKFDGELKAKSAVIEELQATDADFRKVEADVLDVNYVEVNGKMVAKSATIEKLQTDKLSATDAEIKYANIDFSNIGKVAMEYFYAKSGLVENVTVSDATITGNLVGVTIKGDLIEANTLVADKLVIKGEDGLYYKLNYDSGALSGEEVAKTVYYKVNHDTEADKYISTEEVVEIVGEGVIVENAYTQEKLEVYTGQDADGSEIYYCIDIDYPDWAETMLHGSTIVANSITATQISVDDLVAFDATIGGFNISSNSIYSGVKESINNSTRGIYMDTDGQFNAGDANNFIKYYLEITYYVVNLDSETGEYIVTDEKIEPIDETLVEDAFTTDGEPIYSSTLSDGTSVCFVKDEKYKLAISASDVLYAINGEQRSIADLGALGEYVKIGVYEDEPCLELGEADSDFKLIITNTRIMFMDGTTMPAYINNESLHINKAEIEDELRFGRFKWKIRDNGNMGLVWEEVIE